MWLWVLLLLTPAQARWVKFETFRFQPVDEGDRDKAFAQYRYKLSRALETRDLPALLPLLSPTIQSKISRRGTVSDFLKAWKLDGKNVHDSEIWNKLRDTVRLGGSFDNGEFKAPYIYSRWPERFPHMDFYAVTAKNTPVRKNAETDSRVIETLTEEIVGRFDELPNGSEWRAVRLPDGITGYVSTEHTRSPLDYRAIFRKVGGEWKLAMFAAGDWEAHERLE